MDRICKNCVNLVIRPADPDRRLCLVGAADPEYAAIMLAQKGTEPVLYICRYFQELKEGVLIEKR